MKLIVSRLVAVVLVLALIVLCAGTSASAVDFSDIDGHWAENTLIKAASDGLLEGNDGQLNPDDPITTAEMIAILTRIFSAEKMASLDGVAGIGTNDWYYDDAAKAVAMGIIEPENGRLDLDNPIKRLDAFVCLARAFQLIEAKQDTSVLSDYDDGNNLTGEFRLAAAALVDGGFIEGYSGDLHSSDRLTRAEFVTVLYRIATVYGGDNNSVAVVGGGLVVSDIARLNNTVFSGNLYFDCASTAISLINVTAPAIVIRSENLRALSLYSCHIDRLVFANGDGNLSFTMGGTNNIQTAVIGTGGGSIQLAGRLGQLEVTGDNRSVVVNAPVDSITVSGNTNQIVIGGGASATNLTTLPVAGGNTLTINGSCTNCDIYGSGTTLVGYGSVVNMQDYTSDSEISVTAANTNSEPDFGLNDVSIDLSSPDSVNPYESLEASVGISAPEGKDLACTGRWYINNTPVSDGDIQLGAQTEDTLTIDPRSFRADTPTEAILTYVLSCSLPGDIYQEIRVEKTVTLEPKTQHTIEEVLSIVQTGYGGDYTLAWAEANDYDDVLKEEWVNLKDYRSPTDYLVWVSIKYQRVNVFLGSQKNWKLEQSFIVGSGASGTATPVGVFSVLARRTVGWTTSAYTVEPLVNFYSSAYAFHSRLYYPNTRTIKDPRIGFPISHGCIRMYDEDIAYMFDMIPVGTTVVIY